MHRLPRRSSTLVLFAIMVLGLAASACTGIASPKGWASPVASDGLLLVAHEDVLLALDADNLVARWEFSSEVIDEDIEALYGNPAVQGETVFVPGFGGNLYALDTASGGLRWQPFETDGPLIGGVTLSADTVYFGSSDGKIYALDVDSGRLRWDEPFETGDEVWSAPALAGDTLYVTSLDGRLHALDAATGTERWSFRTGAGIASPPVVDSESGLVYVGGFDGELRAIDPKTQEERWSVQADNWFWTRPLVVDGVVYAGSLDGRMYAVEAVSGEMKWPEPFDAGEPIRSAPLISGGALIIIDRGGNVYGIDPSDGSPAFGGPLVLGSDVLADPLLLSDTDGEQVLVVTTGGDLVVIDPATLQIVRRVPLTGK